MSQHITPARLATLAAVSDAPPRTRTERNFDLPVSLFVITVCSYLAFFAVMAATFMTGELMIPMSIFVLTVLMIFGVPTMWTRMRPDDTSHALSWSAFSQKGIVTQTGRLTAGEASAQVLVLPVLVVFWGVIVAIIAAVVA